MGTDQETAEKPAEKAIEAKGDSIRQEYTFAADVKLKECKYCRVMIPKKAKVCPNCKMILKGHMFLKVIAAIMGIAVIGTGSYCLAAYWGLLPDSAVPVWIAQHKMAASVTTVETPEAAAGAMAVEPMEVATAAETAEMAETKEAESSKEELNEQTKSAAESDSAKDEDAAKDEDIARDEDTVNGRSVAEDQSSVEDQSGSEAQDLTKDKADSEEKEPIEDKAGLEEKEPEEDKSDAEDTKDKSDAEDKVSSEDSADSKVKNATKDIDATESEEAEEDSLASNLEDMDENEVAFRADCVRRKYKGLLRDKDYLGTAVLVMEAEVVCQVDGGLFDENVYYLCQEEENGIECYYIIRDDRSVDETLILEGDIITVYGRLFGTCKIPANLIETRPTVPAISMLTYDLLEE